MWYADGGDHESGAEDKKRTRKALEYAFASELRKKLGLPAEKGGLLGGITTEDSSNGLWILAVERSDDKMPPISFGLGVGTEYFIRVWTSAPDSPPKVRQQTYLYPNYTM